MIISGLEKFTLLDYPGKMSAIIFTYGCDMRCPYCHNPELVVEPPQSSRLFSEEDILSFLKRRVGQLEALVITGGEPTMHRDLEQFILRVRELGFQVKLDSNGGSPKRIEEILSLGIVDYWAIDVKYGLELYEQGLNGGRSISADSIKQSIQLVMESGTDYEFRTTLVRGLHDERTVKQIGEQIKGAKKYFIQNFRPGKTIDTTYDISRSFTDSELTQFKSIMEDYVESVVIR